MIGILAGTLSGVGIGVVSGLLPGIHVNTMAGILLTFQVALLPVFGPGMLAATLFAALITHTFLDAIPSTFLGIPDPDTALSVLPLHGLCMEGRGEEAVRVSALGSAAGSLIAVPLSLSLLLILPSVQEYADWAIGIILIGVMGYLIVSGESPGWGLLVFAASGFLGIFTFHFSYLGTGLIGNPGLLMPLLGGLFGIAILIFSGTGPVPPQKFEGLKMDPGLLTRSSLLGACAGTLVGWLPGLSNATANAVLATGIRYNQDRRGYIMAVSSANTVNAMVGLAAFFAIARTRNGVMVAFSSLETPSMGTLLAVGALAASAAYLLTICLAGFAGFFSGIDKKSLNIWVGTFISAVTLIICGPFGVFILILATAVGIIPRLLNIAQVYCMGAIMLPVMLFSFGIQAL
ncbi:MAG TPA: tripartite tricarboxylate transporter permease [Methanoregulaceae archaeon]|nr:tripartite tricarboxylate transporter permease [Methanoregulaceae archaeon]